MKKLIFCLAGLLIIASLPGCGSAKKPFVGYYNSDFTSLAPLADVGATSKAVLRNMHDSIYQYETTGDLKLGLASSIDVTSDATHITFDITLKDNIKFHNGSAITASDVEYSYKRLAGMIDGIPLADIKSSAYFPNLLNGDPAKGFAKGSIEVVSDKRLKVKVDDNYGVMTSKYSLADGYIIPKNYSEDQQKVHPIGAGPYEFVSYSEGNKIVMKSFKDYYLGEPEVKDVEFRKYADQTALTLAFETGEIDLLQLNNENYQSIKDKGYFIYEGLSNDVRGLFFNFKDEKKENDGRFASSDLRKAFMHGINRDNINNLVTGGRGKVLDTHMSPALEKYLNPEVKNLYPYNVETAKNYLKAAGYENGLTVTLKVPTEDPYSVDIATIMKEDLKKINVTANVESITWDTYYQDVYVGRKFEVALINIAGYPDPSRILSRYNAASSGNMGNYNNPKIASLLSEAYKEADEAKALLKYKEVQKIISQDCAANWVVDIGSQFALTSNYKGYKNYPFAYYDISLIKYA